MSNDDRKIRMRASGRKERGGAWLVGRRRSGTPHVQVLRENYMAPSYL